MARLGLWLSCAFATAACVAGCADVFGLSGYSFDEIADGGLPEAGPTFDASSPVDSATADAEIDSGPPAPTCTDAIANGTETDVDCGGSCATKCVAKAGCLENTDCQGELACIDRTCLSPSANDGVKNGTETDIDCGGPDAPTCGTGKACVEAQRDCTSFVCTANLCQAPAPNDGVKNGAETDIDCGGGTAPACGSDKKCLDGFRDCTSLVCTNLVCRPPSAFDGYKNGTETDVDCGGGAAPTCIVGKICAVGARDCSSGVCNGGTCAAAAPSDGVKNGSETDIDCGGGSAPACIDGKTCAQGPRDCTSRVCTGGICQVPTSNDGAKNGSETDVDCGGGAAPACIDGKACSVGARDCVSLVCGAANSCLAPTTNDGVKNGTETDIDCGGSVGAPACNDGRVCVVGIRDCSSRVCTGGICQVPTSGDGVRNGTETDIDCGGGNGVPRCIDTRTCVVGNRDCVSRVCAGFTCQAPTNNDGVKNGTETDIDCGGGNGAPTCEDGLVCADGPRDCTSTNCVAETCQPL
jgi:hypothetical protein